MKGCTAENLYFDFLLGVVSPANVLWRSSSTPYSLTLSVAVLDGEPFGISLTVRVAAVSVVEQMAKLMDQDIVEVEILNSFLRPDQLPIILMTVDPSPAKHNCFGSFSWTRRPTVVFDEACFDGVQVQSRSPLHAIARETSLFASHAAQLNNFQRFEHRRWKLSKPCADIVRCDDM